MHILACSSEMLVGKWLSTLFQDEVDGVRPTAYMRLRDVIAITAVMNETICASERGQLIA